MTNQFSHYSHWLSSKLFSTHTCYLSLIFLSMAWNAFNTHQNQFLAERQIHIERTLIDLGLTSVSPLNPSEIRTWRSIERWFIHLFPFMQPFLATELQSITDEKKNKKIIIESNPVRFVFLEMPSEILDTCFDGSRCCQGHRCLFDTSRFVTSTLSPFFFKHA